MLFSISYIEYYMLNSVRYRFLIFAATLVQCVRSLYSILRLCIVFRGFVCSLRLCVVSWCVPTPIYVPTQSSFLIYPQRLTSHFLLNAACVLVVAFLFVEQEGFLCWATTPYFCTFGKHSVRASVHHSCNIFLFADTMHDISLIELRYRFWTGKVPMIIRIMLSLTTSL